MGNCCAIVSLPKGNEITFIDREGTLDDIPPEHLTYGLTLPAIRHVYKNYPSTAVEDSNKNIPENLDGTLQHPINRIMNGYVSQYVIDKWGEEDDLSVCERLKGKIRWKRHVGKAEIFISWPLSSPVENLLDAIELYMKENELPLNQTYFCILDYVTRSKTRQDELKYLSHIVKQTKSTVILLEPWNDPLALRDANCVREIYYTLKKKKKIDAMMSIKQFDSFKACLSDDNLDFESIFYRVDIMRIKCRTLKEKLKFLSEVKKELGIVECNMRVISLLRQVLTRKAKEALSVSPDECEKTLFITNLASFLMSQELQERAKELFDETEHKSDNLRISSIVKLASNMINLGKIEVAEELSKKAIDEIEKAGKDNMGNSLYYEDQLSANTNLALILQMRKEYHQALHHFDDILSESKQKLGRYDKKTISACYHLAMVHILQKNYDKAKPLCEMAIKDSKIALGDRHPITLRSMNVMGILLHKAGFDKPSLILFQKLYRVRREVFGDEHPDTLDTLQWIDVIKKQLVVKEDQGLRFGDAMMKILFRADLFV